MAVLDDNGPDPTAERADPRGDPFLWTEFAIPDLPASFVRRDRLVRHLDEALHTPLTVVDGAAGAGKTLLVADWASACEGSVAWLTAQVTVKGCGTFWAYLLQALRRAGVALSTGIGKPTEADRVDEGLLTRLAAELSRRDRPVILVIDEYDRVTGPEIADQLEFLLRHTAQGMRLVLVTRTEPLLSLHRHRAAGAITEIRNSELAFTTREAADLLERHGLSLPADEVSALVERTRGWAAGLRLSALAARTEPDPRRYLKEFEVDRSTIADFLLAEVLRRQSAETQDLLLRISILDRFCAALADELTGRCDAELLLADLHRENAFIEHLGHGWFRLHPLFREILRAHLRVRSPGLEAELHRRAAHWMRPTGPLAETLDHAAAADDWECATGALIGDLAIGELFTGLHAGTLSELFSRMGPEPRSPATHLVRAARELHQCHVERGLARLEEAGRALAGDVLDDADPEPAATRLTQAFLEALAARLTGSPGRAETAAQAVEELRHEVPGRLLDEHPELTALLSAHLGSARLWAGRFTEARSALSTVAESCPEPATAQVRAECLGHLALIDYLKGWPGRAERKASAALCTVGHCAQSPVPGAGLESLVLAAVAADRDELDRAEALLVTAVDAGGPSSDPVTRAAQAIVTGRILLARGKTQDALEAADRAVAAEVPSPWAQAHAALLASAAHLAEGRPDLAAKLLEEEPGDEPVCLVGAAQAELAAGRTDPALELLDRLRPQRGLGPAVTVRAALVRAQVAGGSGDRATQRRLVAQALREARREGLRRPLLDAGPWLRPLLTTMPLRALAEGWLIPGPPPSGTPVPSAEQPPLPMVDELSARERDVLRRLAEMMSTEEIAADLYVSVNTVKTHLKSAYRKLAVNRRYDAVHRARDLGLL
ncbi:LuxR C-terminal-related transcriptional regulator [Streptomyces sp. MUM 16J]|uniref:LuxR C-terminal-related transcriptional regulator n=1 Tax=Streptomyces sp. MUM 16J TaxID=2791988 RepID=UPI001F049E2C|nr:LuxR C-terminal-related transcriptional regulator [Streptomyces sp. MUM 16J]MCH0557310.1 AAA family ATPase [Streptomyces sp. MUM 16J]